MSRVAIPAPRRSSSSMNSRIPVATEDDFNSQMWDTFEIPGVRSCDLTLTIATLELPGVRPYDFTLTIATPELPRIRLSRNHIPPPPTIATPEPPGIRPSRHYIPLPPTIQGQAELNPLLRSGHGCLIRYRLVAPPTAASAFGTNSHWMLEAATSPRLRSMTIAASDVSPWPIIVHASTNPLFVTVGDVLTAVHNALHTVVTEPEYRLALPPDMIVGNRYWNGMRRLSLLNGRHWWAGLSKSQEGPEIWNLHLQ